MHVHPTRVRLPVGVAVLAVVAAALTAYARAVGTAFWGTSYVLPVAALACAKVGIRVDIQ